MVHSTSEEGSRACTPRHEWLQSAKRQKVKSALSTMWTARPLCTYIKMLIIETCATQEESTVA